MKKSTARKVPRDQPNRKRAKAPRVAKEKAPSTFPGVVGIGASAGGLDAFSRLLHNLERDTGLAYVLVQHLSPEHESSLPELLGRAATIPVTQAQDGMVMEADHVYVIPPAKTMTVTDGHIRLVRRPKGRGLHLPIDTFLQSLAEVHGAGAIGVILSGAGSDGSRGVVAIKQAGGITFAQDSASAKHPNMPEAAVDTDSVDFVLTPEEIAVQLGKIGKYFAQTGEHPALPDETTADDKEIGAILKLLLRRTGVDFSQYRRGTVRRRILRRMLVNRLEKRSDYLASLTSNSGELELLYNDLLIGVTSFFRDPQVFDELRALVFPSIVESRTNGDPLRIWVAGCSGGEESYSIAIALFEFLEENGLEMPVQMFGTDLSDVAIARARAGLYPESIAEQVSPERLRRFFIPDRGGYRIAKFVRDVCIFSRQNIARDPPFSRLDLVSCRNVLIYFEQGLQRKIFPTFHYALKPHGMLLLGTAESPGAASDLFEPISKRHKIYRRRERSHDFRDLDFVNYTPSGPVATTSSSQKRAVPLRSTGNGGEIDGQIDRLLLSRYGRQGVVVNEDFEIKSFRGDTTPFLAHASGSASLDLLKLARPDLVMPLRMALSRATTENQFVSEKHRTRSPAGELEVMIDILPLSAKPASKRLFLILFQEQPVESSSRSKKKDAAPDSKNSRKMKAGETQSVRDELAASKAYLSEIIEQHEASIEELQAAAEEIQSSNEELQSTNEELETTKEEVQSTNEELTTLNDELQQRNREIGEIAGDLANVFASTTIPIAIIGRDLRLRRFTPALSRVMKVIPTDAGRPLSDVKLSFTLPGLDRLISNSIETLAVNRALAKHDDGSMWAVTIRPYQTLEKRVDGAIIVFTDGSEASEERRLALEAAEVARAAAVRSVEELSAAVGRRDRAEGDRTLLLLRLQSAQEEERAHFSRELHDELGQHLTMLGLGLSELSTTAPTGSEIGRRTDELRAIVNTLGRELHGVAQRLRPKGLDDFGLEAALSSYAQDWSKQTGIALDLHISEESERLPLLIETAAYRVAQEAMTNIAKHSGATRAGITIERRDGSLNLIIDDNGKGFESRVVSPSSHAADGMGLIGIRERIALLEGSVQIETGLGDGVTLYIRIPIERSLLGA